MQIYRILLTAHDDIFFATYEMGSLIETGVYLHNYALSYALFENYLVRPNRQVGRNAQRPGYVDPLDERSLLCLNELGIYVFPAKPIKIVRCSEEDSVINPRLPVEEGYYRPVRKQFGDSAVQGRRNRPYGPLRCKGLWIGSEHCAFVVSRSAINFPAWIRLGKWAAKVKVDIQEHFDNPPTQIGSFELNHPINPIDSSIPIGVYHKKIVMPPSSLVSVARLTGEHWNLYGVSLPTQMCYGCGFQRQAR